MLGNLYAVDSLAVPHHGAFRNPATFESFSAELARFVA
jgi:hypothetical protein